MKDVLGFRATGSRVLEVFGCRVRHIAVKWQHSLAALSSEKSVVKTDLSYVAEPAQVRRPSTLTKPKAWVPEALQNHQPAEFGSNQNMSSIATSLILQS